LDEFWINFPLSFKVLKTLNELWTIKKATHANIMKSEHKNEYEQMIIAFLDSQIENGN
jgi:hypothetical protein